MMKYSPFIICILIFNSPYILSAHASDLGEHVKFVDIEGYIEAPCGDADIIINDGIAANAYEYGLQAISAVYCEDPRNSGRSPSISGSLVVFPIDENSSMDDYLAYIKSSTDKLVIRYMDVFEEDPLKIKVIITTYAGESKTSSGGNVKTLSNYSEFNDFIREINSLESALNNNIVFAEKILLPSELQDFKNALEKSNHIEYTFDIRANTNVKIVPKHFVHLR